LDKFPNEQIKVPFLVWYLADRSPVGTWSIALRLYPRLTKADIFGIVHSTKFTVTVNVKPSPKKSAVYLFRYFLFEGLNYALSCAKNCVKLLIGRKPYFNEQNIIFRQYLRHVLGIQPIKVTCYFPGEGAGFQAAMMMRLISFARASGLVYVHTPFTDISHADRPKALWVEAWEAQFNLGLGEELATESDNRGIMRFTFKHWSVVPTLFGFDEHDLTRRFETTIAEFRRKYYLNKSPIKNEVFTICVHIRRGDMMLEARFISTSIFKKVVSEVTAVLDARGTSYKVQIFTQGDLCDFAGWDVPGVEIFSDVDAIWSMQQMIAGDIFIMSKSAYSYVAATISDGIKIGEEDFRYAPLSGWIIVDSNGEFDRMAFEAELAQHIEAKIGNRLITDARMWRTPHDQTGLPITMSEPIGQIGQ
jgi:hypothetical protein